MAKKSIKEWLVENKNSIYIGILGSFIWQIIVFGVSIVPNIGSSVSETIENLLYSTAAVISIDYMIVILFSFLIGIIFGISIFKTLYFIFKKIIEIKNKIFIKRESKKTEYEIFKSKLNKVLNALSLCSIMLTIILAFTIASFKLKMGFDLDMASIKPYISNEQYDILISDWTQMKNKKQYDNIYSTIKKIQKEHKLSGAIKNLK